MSKYITWKDKEFVEFFEKEILPKCKDWYYIKKQACESLWKIHASWHTKLLRNWRKGARKFLKKYNLFYDKNDNIEELFKKFVVFFEKKILPKCKNNKMLRIKDLDALWIEYSSWYRTRSQFIKHWYIKNLSEFLSSYWLKTNMSDALSWNYDNFIKFFEEKILPLCENRKMVSSDRLFKMWWKYRKWNAKFRLFTFPDKFKDYNEFLDLYNLDWNKKQKYKWWEKNLISFFETKILPRCKDNIMLKSGEIWKLWHKYKSWLSSFYVYIHKNNLTYDSFFSKYWLVYKLWMWNTKYWWNKETFYIFFEEFILPECKDKIFISSTKLSSMWLKYKSWYSLYSKWKLFDRFNSKQEFYKHYKLKQNKRVAKLI